MIHPKMNFAFVLILSCMLSLMARSAFGGEEQAEVVWDASAFKYERPKAFVVEETTPTAQQVDWHGRPVRLAANLPAPKAANGVVKPWTNGTLRVTHLRFRDLEGADVPVLLTLPAQGEGPFPVVVALHGLGSNKAQVMAQIAPALVKRGFAVLAPDLPLHGERAGDPRGMFDQKDLRGFVARARQAIQDTRLCIDLAEGRPELDTKAGVMLVGYSMGAIFNSVVGPADARVKAMCLLVGGTPNFPAIFAGVPQLAALQPQLAIARFTGPVLMLNATRDHIISKEMTDRLFGAAAEPKQLKWYDSDHMLPAEAYEEAAKWVAETFKAVGKKA